MMKENPESKLQKEQRTAEKPSARMDGRMVLSVRFFVI